MAQMKEYQKICRPMEIKPKKNLNVSLIDSLECFEILKVNKDTHLVDVRTKPEWLFVGVPDLSTINKNAIFVSWQDFPLMNKNSNFEKEIANAGLKKNDRLYFICRSGKRSFEAAKHMIKKGYTYCYNITDGFEGDKNFRNRRSTINGWKFNRLPWKQ